MSEGFTTFKKKLADGQYANATGARRAIGKFRKLEEGEADKARVLVNKHFGEAAKPATPKKAAAKPAATTGPGKGRKPRPAKGKAAAPKATPAAAKPAAAPPKKRAPAVAKAPEAASTTSLMDTIERSIENAAHIREIDPKADVTRLLDLVRTGNESVLESMLKVSGVSVPARGGAPAPTAAKPLTAAGVRVGKPNGAASRPAGVPAS